MKSEIGGGVDGRSTYFTHEQHVDDQNSHRQHHEERDQKDLIEDIISNTITIQIMAEMGAASHRDCDQCQTDNDFLRSGSSAQLACLYKRITHYFYTTL